MFNTQIFEGAGQAQSGAVNIPNSHQQHSRTANGGDDQTNVPQPIDITYQRQALVFNPRLRRELIAHLQGMGGVSWGSVTIGLWLKDEVMMITQQQQQQNHQFQQQQQQQQLQQHHHHHQLHNNNGTSTFSNSINLNNGFLNPKNSFSGQRFPNNSVLMLQLPLNNHALYLPDLEADYCKDYLCCGQLLPTLHDLLRHYEDAHISASPPQDNPLLQHQNRNRNNMINNTMHNVLETVSTNDVFLNNNQGLVQHQTNLNLPSFNIQQQTINQINPMFDGQQQQQQNQLQNTHINPGSTQVNPTDQTLGQFGQPNHQHTQQQQQRQLQQQQQQQQRQNQQQHQHQQLMGINPGQSNNGGSGDDDGMYIDDPARHLYVMEQNEHKPYKCPVIGCDKNYKNQNGLKYHRLHGHQNQTLKENPDGTISIIDPESNTPYLDGAGMEKDKPYRCEVCGKRYKNLNGLKYHRGHTTH